MNRHPPPYVIRIPSDSNLIYLPLMYFLPMDLIARCPTLRALPRKVREVMYSVEMMEIIDSDVFLNEIMDAGAALAFPHFGFGGWKEHYTGYCPVWKLSYALPLLEQAAARRNRLGVASPYEYPQFPKHPIFHFRIH